MEKMLSFLILAIILITLAISGNIGNMWLIILIVTDNTSLERYLALTYLDMI